MNKFTQPSINKKFLRYGVMVHLPNGEHCWVTEVKGEDLKEIGFYKGLAWFTKDKAAADLVRMRLLRSRFPLQTTMVSVVETMDAIADVLQNPRDFSEEEFYPKKESKNEN